MPVLTDEDIIKPSDARLLCEVLEFEWDYENADDDDVYEALAIHGYHWFRHAWRPMRSTEPKKPRKARKKKLTPAEQLAAWNEGKPL